MIKISDKTRQNISDVISYLQGKKYLTVNPKQIGNFDNLMDKYETVLTRQISWKID